MIHTKMAGLTSGIERVAKTVVSTADQVRRVTTAPSGSASYDNADGTRTIIGPQSGTSTMATHVGDTTPPGVPTGLSAVSGGGCVYVAWDGTLDGGIPGDFDHVNIGITIADTEELIGTLTEAGIVSTVPMQTEATATVWATSEDDCCLADGTAAHNVSERSEPISVAVVQAANADAIAELQASIAQVAETATQAQQVAARLNTYIRKVHWEQEVESLIPAYKSDLNQWRAYFNEWAGAYYSLEYDEETHISTLTYTAFVAGWENFELPVEVEPLTEYTLSFDLSMPVGYTQFLDYKYGVYVQTTTTESTSNPDLATQPHDVLEQAVVEPNTAYNNEHLSCTFTVPEDVTEIYLVLSGGAILDGSATDFVVEVGNFSLKQTGVETVGHDGLLATYEGMNVGALINADGSFDVRILTWQDGEPIIGADFATLQKQLISLGKGLRYAAIEFCDAVASLRYTDYSPLTDGASVDLVANGASISLLSRAPYNSTSRAVLGAFRDLEHYAGADVTATSDGMVMLRSKSRPSPAVGSVEGSIILNEDRLSVTGITGEGSYTAHGAWPLYILTEAMSGIWRGGGFDGGLQKGNTISNANFALTNLKADATQITNLAAGTGNNGPTQQEYTLISHRNENPSYGAQLAFGHVGIYYRKYSNGSFGTWTNLTAAPPIPSNLVRYAITSWGTSLSFPLKSIALVMCNEAYAYIAWKTGEGLVYRSIGDSSPNLSFSLASNGILTVTRPTNSTLSAFYIA